MSLSIGIVGFPNVGKSTLFNALLKKQVALAANYPFATIEPNVGVAEVPDNRLTKLAGVVKTTVIKPAIVEFTDIAGLVKGAHKGEGLGNKFLAHIRETSAIAHVLRNFTDQSVLREGTTTPKEDLANIRMELQLADLETLSKQKEPKGRADKEDIERWGAIEKLRFILESGKNVIFSLEELEKNVIEVADDLCLLTAKPEIFVINIDEIELKNQTKIIEQYSKELEIDKKQIVVVSAQIESELATLTIEDQKLYMEDLGIERSGLERLAEVAYETLNLQSFLTAGEKEVRAWTIKKGTTASQAAGVIHTDFMKKFIKAKVVKYSDFIATNGWNGAREQGKIRVEGRDYVMRADDVVEFMIG